MTQTALYKPWMVVVVDGVVEPGDQLEVEFFRTEHDAVTWINRTAEDRRNENITFSLSRTSKVFTVNRRVEYSVMVNEVAP